MNEIVSMLEIDPVMREKKVERRIEKKKTQIK